ncbi:MAG: NACHT domain-containing protein [Bacteroidetes bacterium]|nr:NACHT domain-containing protein [Bacteroidota bacterium]
MHDERDYLVKYVFPTLRKRLDTYHIDFMDIDLRWGITEQQAEDGRVLDLCLNAIEKSRPGKEDAEIPFFIGLLGQRYGWVPDNLPEDALEQQPWLKEERDRGRSMTELEIMQAVLNNPEMKGQAFFYFRTDGYLSDVPSEKRWRYTDPDESQIEKLDQLKERIRESPYPVKTYDADWDGKAKNRHFEKKYKDDGEGRLTNFRESEENRRAWYEVVIEDLWESIRRELELPEEPRREQSESMLQREHDFHQRFIETRRQGVSDKIRVELHDRLIRYATGEVYDIDDFDFSRPLMLTGAQGSGKSTVMAGLAEDLQQRMDNDKQEKLLVIPHFAGAGPASTELRELLTRVVEMLGDAYNQEYETGVELRELIATFQKALEAVPEDKEVVLIIDAINQFIERNGTHELGWLPYELPENVKVVLSTIHSKEETTIPAERAQLLGYNRVEVEPLTLAERKIILREVPAIAVKTLSDKHIEDLLRINASKNPLFLRVALEELRGYGTHDTLEQQIETYRTSGKSEKPLRAIFVQVFKRLEAQFDQTEDTSLTREVLSLLGSARRGLTEDELNDLTEELINSGDLMFLLRHLRPYLMRRGPIITFFHDALFDAVHRHYLHNEDQQHKKHQTLADYFGHKDQLDFKHGYESENREPNVRKVDELPYHLLKLKQPHELAKLLKELSFVEAKAVSGLVTDLAEDYHGALEQLDLDSDDYYLLNVLSRAIDHEIGFLVRHPELIFQVCWNRGWWYDAPEVANYAELLEEAPEEYIPPWERERKKVYEILEIWQVTFSNKKTKKVWTKLLNPYKDTFSLKSELVQCGSSVRKISWSPDGIKLAIAANERLLNWNIKYKTIHSSKEHYEPIQQIVWLNGANELITIPMQLNKNSVAKIWKGVEANDFKLPSFEFIWTGSKNGNFFLVSHGNNYYIFNRKDKSLSSPLQGNSGSLYKSLFSPNEFLLASFDKNNLLVWNIYNIDNPIKLDLNNCSHIESMCWSNDSSHFAVIDQSRNLHIWIGEISGKADLTICLSKHLDEKWQPTAIPNLEWSPNNEHIAISYYSNFVCIVSIENPFKPHVISAHSNGVLVIKWSPDGRFLATGSSDYSVQIWETTRFTEYFKLLGHEGFIYDLDWTPDSKKIASASQDGTVRIWYISNQIEYIKIKHDSNNSFVYFMKWSYDNNLLAYASYNTIKVIDINLNKTFIFRHRDERHSDETQIENIIWSSDNNQIASYSKNQIYIHSLFSPNSSIKMNVSGGLEFLKWSKCGNKIVYTTSNFDIILWNLVTSNKRKILYKHNNKIRQISFSNDSRYLASYSSDNTVIIYDLILDKVSHQQHVEKYDIEYIKWKKNTLLAISVDKFKIRVLTIPGLESKFSLSHSIKSLIFHGAILCDDCLLLIDGDPDELHPVWHIYNLKNVYPYITTLSTDSILKGQLKEVLKSYCSHTNDLIGYRIDSNIYFMNNFHCIPYERANIWIIKYSGKSNIYASAGLSEVHINKIIT